MNLRSFKQKRDTSKLTVVLKENTWLSRYTTFGMKMDFGWGNGYVDLPKDHPMWGKHYDDIPVEVHGGLTYSEKTPDGMWRVGFDTAHLGDTFKKWPRSKVEEEANRLAKQLEDMICD